MRLFATIAVLAALFALLSLAAIYSYGRFVKQARGKPSSALPVAECDTLLDRVVSPKLKEHPGKSGLLLVTSNLQAFAIRALTARCAERSLDLQYYYWKDDLTGGLLARELIAAADRGVRVRVILDDINTKGDDSAYLALDSHSNIDIRLFNPSRSRSNALRRGIEMALRAFSVTRRMHSKAWIADGRVAVVGGRNIGDAYFDASETSNFRDMDIVLLGPVFASSGNCAGAVVADEARAVAASPTLAIFSMFRRDSSTSAGLCASISLLLFGPSFTREEVGQRDLAIRLEKLVLGLDIGLGLGKRNGSIPGVLNCSRRVSARGCPHPQRHQRSRPDGKFRKRPALTSCRAGSQTGGPGRAQLLGAACEEAMARQLG